MEDKNRKIAVLALIFALLGLSQAGAISTFTINLIAGTGINITQSGDNYTISATGTGTNASDNGKLNKSGDIVTPTMNIGGYANPFILNSKYSNNKLIIYDDFADASGDQGFRFEVNGTNLLDITTHSTLSAQTIQTDMAFQNNAVSGLGDSGACYNNSGSIIRCAANDITKLNLTGGNLTGNLSLSNNYLNNISLGEANPTNVGIGGTISTVGLYTMHTFTSNGTFIPPTNLPNICSLVVGGGGGGGFGGGGGAGGVNFSCNQSINKTYNITIGSGGVGFHYNPNTQGTNGNNSTFDNISVVGGGRGGAAALNLAGSGGSGGGASGSSYGGINIIGNGTVGQGSNGGQQGTTGGGAGGGANQTGANGAGAVGGNGGTGYTLSINSILYGGGGGAGGDTAGSGGNGGGGAGASGDNNGGNGTTNTGGGGGGIRVSNGLSTQAGFGGSGIVILYYLTNTPYYFVCYDSTNNILIKSTVACR